MLAHSSLFSWLKAAIYKEQNEELQGAQEQEVGQEWEVSQESDRAGGGDQKGSSIVLSRNSHAWWPLIADQVGSGGAFLLIEMHNACFFLKMIKRLY